MLRRSTMPKLKEIITHLYDHNDGSWTVGQNCSRIEHRLNKVTGSAYFRLYGMWKLQEIVLSDVNAKYVQQIMYDKEAQIK